MIFVLLELGYRWKPVIITGEATIGSGYPQYAILIFKKVRDNITAETITPARLCTKDKEIIAIIAIEPIFRAYPIKASLVLQDAIDLIVRESIVRVELFEIESRWLSLKEGDQAIKHEYPCIFIQCNSDFLPK